MNIVIVGASDIGLHLAAVFSKQGERVILLDKDSKKLELVGRELDIATRIGSGTDWELIENLMEFSPELLVALTHDDETNLVICTIAKHLGYPRTIARVRASKYLLQSRLNFEQLFCVDHLISPEWLTAESIANQILISESLTTESFSHGLVQMRTLQMPSSWNNSTIPLKNRSDLQLPDDVMIGLINRATTDKHSSKNHLIFPHGHDVILPHDEVTVVGKEEVMRHINRFFGTNTKVPASILVVGGSLIAIHLIKMLQKYPIRIMILEKDYDKCCRLAEILPHITIVHRSGTDFDYLKAEKIGDFDAVVACTRQDEVNFMVGMLAKELGVETVICSLSDTNYLSLLKKVGLVFTSSPRIQATNRILSIAREKTVISTVSVYNHQIEVIEVKVSADSKIVGIPIRHLAQELPNDLLILTILSRGRVMIADGSRVLSPGDTVVLITTPKHARELNSLF